MGGRVTRQGWASQPQYPVEIDWENPDTRDLRFMYVGSMPVDLVTGRTATVVGGAAPRTINGGNGAAIGPDISGTSYLDFGTRESWNVLGRMTLFWRGQIDSAAGAFRCPISKANNNGAATTPFDVYIDSGSGRVAFGKASTSYRYFATANAAASGSVNAFAFVATTDDMLNAPLCALNSSRLETASVFADNGGTGLATGNTNSLKIGRRDDGATQLDGAPEVSMLWARSLSQEEYARVYQNPYSLLKPVRRRLYIIGATSAGTFKPAWAIGSNQLLGGGYAS